MTPFQAQVLEDLLWLTGITVGFPRPQDRFGYYALPCFAIGIITDKTKVQTHLAFMTTPYMFMQFENRQAKSDDALLRQTGCPAQEGMRRHGVRFITIGTLATGLFCVFLN